MQPTHCQCGALSFAITRCQLLLRSVCCPPCVASGCSSPALCARSNFRTTAARHRAYLGRSLLAAELPNADVGFADVGLARPPSATGKRVQTQNASPLPPSLPRIPFVLYPRLPSRLREFSSCSWSLPAIRAWRFAKRGNHASARDAFKVAHFRASLVQLRAASRCCATLITSLVRPGRDDPTKSRMVCGSTKGRT